MRYLFSMLRVPNLVIIALTFIMLRNLVFISVYSTINLTPWMSRADFFLMIIITLWIAATGYIINDYYDVVTDQINKPEKQYIGSKLSPASALASAITLSILSVFFALLLSWRLNSWHPAALLLSALGIVWWYALRLKRSFVWGNIAVAGMSAGTVAMCWILENHSGLISSASSAMITQIVTAISIFAFMLSLLREIVKDMEDMEGDKLINCRSLPIMKGISYTKNILYLIISTTIIFLLISQAYLFHFQKFISVAWLLISVEIPLLYFSVKLKKSESKTDFHNLSTMLKLTMLGGMLTMFAGQF